ncbi:hypothetical protein [Scandinavium goeteborgense]|uniref:Uncharacterized protein n=1 Tax=Scandinavium goeteborgense TaxID=1851514 RepID=A0A4R6E3U0_SCAGO|nr:hypothetical protein [Scandinavium goeteborgense]TDN51508.1 hypothetical protein EC847_11837 [Scandinavium goeteborgense]
MKLNSIITPSEGHVKPGGMLNRHTRILREPVAVADLDPALRALGRNIARRVRKGKPVHVPALRGRELGHILRTLELKRAFN